VAIVRQPSLASLPIVAKYVFRIAIVAFVVASASSADAQTTALFFDSQQGDYIGAGIQRSYTAADATFQIRTYSAGNFDISVIGPSYDFWWYLHFAAANGAPLQVGLYPWATRWPFTPFTGMDVSGDGRGCNELTGRFLVREIAYGGDGSIVRFAVDFEQHCEDANAALFGVFRYNSTVSSTVPFDGVYPSYKLQITPSLHGSVSGGGLNCGTTGSQCDATFAMPTTVTLTATPDPGYYFAGWTVACHGSLTVSAKVNMEKRCSPLFYPLVVSQPTTLLMWNSQQGDYVGQGRREIYNASNSRWTFSPYSTTSVINLEVDSIDDNSDVWWYLRFAAPTGQTIHTGTYNNAARFSSATQAGIDVSGDGRGCNTIAGSFTIYDLAMVGATVTRLALDFEQHCEGAVIPGRPLRGSIRYNSLVPPQPAIAVTTVGSGAQLTLSPPQTTCVGKCMESYLVGTSVHLTPAPSPGWTLSSWSGDPDCADGVVTALAPMACNATFVQATIGADSSTPNTGAGATQTFALQYSDSLGAADLSTVWVWFNSTFANSSANSCMAYYKRATLTLYLLNDAQTWTAGALGSGATLQNSQCAIDLGGSSASTNGNVLTLNLAMTFKPAYGGAKNIYMYAASGGGGNSGWQTRGTWTAPAPTVTADAATPSSGSGASQLFGLQYSDTAGASDLTNAWVWFNATFASASGNSCILYYNRPSGTLFLLNDSQTTWMPGTVGSGGVLQNTQCAVALAGSSVTLSGDTLTLNLAMTFKAAYAGAKNIYMYAQSPAANSGWQTRGTWTVPIGTGPLVTADTATPDTGSGPTQTFVLQYSDTLGATDLTTTWVWFNATFASTSANSCMLYYNRLTATLYLLNDAQTWTSGTPGSSATLQNSQCAVGLAASSVSLNGNTLTLSLAMTFKPAYAGSKNVYMYAASAAAGVSGWQDRGDWTVPAYAVTADSVTPNNASGTTQTFALQYSDTAGAGDLSTSWVWFTATFASTSTNSCMAYYNRATATLFLLNDGQSWMPGIVGAPGVLQNSQCAVDLGASTVTIIGNTLTLNLALTFTNAYQGTKNIYMYAAGSSANSGWQLRGTHTIP